MTVASDWIHVADTSEFETTDRKCIDLGADKQIGIYKADGAYYAMTVWCSHQKASMFHGDIQNGELECPLHGARFDLKTGRHLCLPAVRPVDVYELKVEGTKILVKA